MKKSLTYQEILDKNPDQEAASDYKMKFNTKKIQRDPNYRWGRNWRIK